MQSQNVQARAARWLEHVGRWRQSGKSKSEYCAAHGLSPHSFRYWLRKSRSSDTVPAVQPTVVPAFHGPKLDFEWRIFQSPSLHHEMTHRGPRPSVARRHER